MGALRGRGARVIACRSARLGPLAATVLLVAGLAGCGDKDQDSGSGAGEGTEGTVDDGGTGGDEGGSTDGGAAEGGDDGADGSQDRDGDGFPASEDCDDSDPLSNPGATEEWNAVDDDCDGRVDADGRYTGELELSAVAVYEGESHSYRLRCPGELERAGPVLTVAITCTPDPEDDLAVLLLGESLRFTLAAEDASGPDWSGSVEVDGGTWTSRAAASIGFVELRDPVLELQMDTVSLDLSGTMSTELVAPG